MNPVFATKLFAYIVFAPSILPKLPVVINEVAVIVPVTVPPLLASSELLARVKAAVILLF